MGGRAVRLTWPAYRGILLVPLAVLALYSNGLLALQLGLLGSVPIKPSYVSALLLLAAAFGWLGFSSLGGRVRLLVPPSLFTICAAYAFYSAASWALAFRFGYPSDYMLFVLLNHVIWILVFGLALCQPGNPRPATDTGRRAWVFALSATTLCLMALGLVQYWSQSLIVPSEYVSGSGEVVQLAQVYEFYGEIRATSIFNSANVFGQYLLFFTVLWLAMALQKGRGALPRVALLALASLSLVTIYTTLTRTNYLLVLSAGLAYFLVARGVRPRTIVALSLALSPLVLWGLLYATASGTLSGSEGLTASGSLSSRVLDWRSMLEEYLYRADTLDVLFGYAFTTSDVFPAPIDNYYLGLFLFSGVVGLLLWILFFLGIFVAVLRRARASGEPVWQAMGSYLFAFVIGANYQNIQSVYLFLIIVFLLFSEVTEKRSAGTGVPEGPGGFSKVEGA